MWIDLDTTFYEVLVTYFLFKKCTTINSIFSETQTYKKDKTNFIINWLARFYGKIFFGLLNVNVCTSICPTYLIFNINVLFGYLIASVFIHGHNSWSWFNVNKNFVNQCKLYLKLRVLWHITFVKRKLLKMIWLSDFHFLPKHLHLSFAFFTPLISMVK